MQNMQSAFKEIISQEHSSNPQEEKWPKQGVFSYETVNINKDYKCLLENNSDTSG